MTPEQKKHLLYGGGALASIVALVLFMKNKAPGNMPVSSAGLGAGSAGAGGVSSGTSANNAAALNAAVALAVEQSRQSNALSVAQLQSQTALQIAGIQAGSLKDQANAKTAQAALGPGGAVTAAAPAAAKGLFDTLKELFAPKPTSQTGGAEDFPGYALYPESKQEGYYVLAATPTENYGMPDFTQYVEPTAYSFSGQPLDLTGSIASADYFQGSIGSGDSGYTGDSVFSYDENGNTGETYA